MTNHTQEIKDKLSIVDVIGGYITVEMAGAQYKARCPFHNEKTPSFFISPDRGSYYCFGCGVKGDIFTFVQEFEGLDFRGALEVLARRAGVVLTTYDGAPRDNKERLYMIMEDAALFFEQEFAQTVQAREYVKNRGVSENTIKAFRIGYRGTEWRTLSMYLKQKGYTDAELLAAGLVKETEKGLYDRFRGRIMFPISDSSGRVIAFTGRLLHDDPNAPKYLNSPDTPLFDKSRVFYGLDKAKHAIRTEKHAIFVEGQFDLILSHQAGFENTVAVSGTALTDETETRDKLLTHLGLIKRLTDTIVLAFDADKAGIKAAGRAAKIALSLGMNVKVVRVPDGKDPADYITEHGADAWKKCIKGAVHIIELYTLIIMEKMSDARERARKIKDVILPYIHAIDSAIEQSYFIKRTSELSGIPEGPLWDDLRMIKGDDPEKKRIIPEAIKNAPVVKNETTLSRLFGILLWQETLSPPTVDVVSVRKKIESLLGDVRYQAFEKTLSVHTNELIFEAEMLYGKDDKLPKIVQDLTLALEEDSLKETLMEQMTLLGEAERVGDTEQKQKLLAVVSEISKKIHDVKHSRFYE